MKVFLKKLWAKAYLKWPLRLRYELFQRALAYPNLKLLLKFKRSEWLSTSLGGKLFLHEKKCLFYRLINFLTWNRLVFRTRMAIYFSMAIFCSNLENPLEPYSIKKLISKKKDIFDILEKKIKKIKGYGLEKIDFSCLLKDYQRKSWEQIALLKKVIHWTEKKSRNNLCIKAQKILDSGSFPGKIGGRTSGSYFIQNKQKEKLFIFKPFDEETFAPNNIVIRAPLGSRKMRLGVKSGEFFHREVATYVVDRYLNFGIVPKTVYAKLSHQVFFEKNEGYQLIGRKKKLKRGSLQVFLSHTRFLDKNNHASDISQHHPSELEKLFVLDMIIGSVDRHYYNILSDGNHLFAIDNGLTFPDVHQQYFWTWYFIFEQAKKPFSKTMSQLIDQVDVQQLITILKQKCYLNVQSYQRLKERIALIKAASKKGLSPVQIRQLFTNDFFQYVYNYDELLDQKAEEAVNDYIRKTHKKSYLKRLMRAIPDEVN